MRIYRATFHLSGDNVDGILTRDNFGYNIFTLRKVNAPQISVAFFVPKRRVAARFPPPAEAAKRTKVRGFHLTRGNDILFYF